jgi:hypothetical protein
LTAEAKAAFRLASTETLDPSHYERMLVDSNYDKVVVKTVRLSLSNVLCTLMTPHFQIHQRDRQLRGAVKSHTQHQLASHYRLISMTKTARVELIQMLITEAAFIFKDNTQVHSSPLIRLDYMLTYAQRTGIWRNPLFVDNLYLSFFKLHNGEAVKYPLKWNPVPIAAYALIATAVSLSFLMRRSVSDIFLSRFRSNVPYTIGQTAPKIPLATISDLTCTNPNTWCTWNTSRIFKRKPLIYGPRLPGTHTSKLGNKYSISCPTATSHSRTPMSQGQQQTCSRECFVGWRWGLSRGSGSCG